MAAIWNRNRSAALIFGLALVMAFGAATVKAQTGNMTDKDITMAVSDAMTIDEGVSGYLIDIKTNDGVVTLSGDVNNIMAKKRARRIAETIKGVRAVINDISVRSADINDDQLTADVKAALVSDPATDTWGVGVAAQDGKVTLTGSVASWQEKRLAGRVAESVRGVRQLENDIAVDYGQPRTDTQIEEDISEILRWDVLVNDDMINVVVDKGKVSLSGTVGSAAEKSRAALDAWVPGVVMVDDNDLKVNPSARSEDFRANKYAAVSDTAIENAVKDAFHFDPRVKSFNIDVSSVDGTVTLTGNVDNLKAKRSAAQDASNTVGVWRVKNRIKVRPEKMKDVDIMQGVVKALKRDPYVSRYDLNVSVINGKVYLGGVVDSYFEKAEADDAASRVKGVMAVENNIRVDNSANVLTYHPYVDYTWDIDEDGWYSYPYGEGPLMTDWEIREDIENLYYWDPFLDHDSINVSVEGGVATLTGTVDTWYQRYEATQKAYDGGAMAVDNELKVVHGPDYYNP
jgi:osmotically-inducible protein OsmY